MIMTEKLHSFENDEVKIFLQELERKAMIVNIKNKSYQEKYLVEFT